MIPYMERLNCMLQDEQPSVESSFWQHPCNVKFNRYFEKQESVYDTCE